MRKESMYRGILIVAGLLAAVIIVFSHSISFNHAVSKKATTEKSDEKSEKKTRLAFYGSLIFLLLLAGLGVYLHRIKKLTIN